MLDFDRGVIIRRIRAKSIILPDDSSDGCWIYLGGKDTHGYGNITINRKSLSVNRIVYEHYYGPLNGLLVLHRCDTPMCWKPCHLFKGTAQDNSDDMISKGRQSKGMMSLKWTQEDIDRVRNYRP